MCACAANSLSAAGMGSAGMLNSAVSAIANEGTVLSTKAPAISVCHAMRHPDSSTHVSRSVASIPPPFRWSGLSKQALLGLDVGRIQKPLVHIDEWQIPRRQSHAEAQWGGIDGASM